MRISYRMAAGLIFAAYGSMGDGGCSTAQSDDRWYTFYQRDVCGSKAPFHWKADKAGRRFKISLKTRAGWSAFLEGTYSEPVLLPCRDDPGEFYSVWEIHDSA